MFNCFIHHSQQAIPIATVLAERWEAWRVTQTPAAQQWLTTLGFIAQPGKIALLPSDDGRLQQVLIILSDEADFWTLGSLPAALPQGHYYYADIQEQHALHRAAMAWGLGAYEFTYYRTSKRPVAQLLVPKDTGFEHLCVKLTAAYRVRDLINLPAEALGPAELADTIFRIGEKFQASVTGIVGDELLSANYPAIHRVGRASPRLPRLIDLRWGETQAPRITLVGKGVCFDSGGLDLKSDSGMRCMKKDMGGAAHAIGLAEMMMAFKLPVRLRLLVPIVENLISGNAYKPGDVIVMRNGSSVEVMNTDAEGRLILADALYEADSECPELLIDFSTLTGAARVALGTEISAFFTSHEKLAADLLRCSEEECDPLWRLPLHKPYKQLLESKLADMTNVGTLPYAGAIVAALFLSAFIKEDTKWVHFDFNAYNVMHRPGRPEGGEVMAMFPLLRYLLEHYPPLSQHGVAQ